MDIKERLFIFFSWLWIIDVVSTIQFVSVFGLESEANPVMQQVLLTFGPAGFVALKLGILLFWASLFKHASEWIGLFLFLVMIPVSFMGLVVAIGSLG
jgi:hypothetical protein